jgi:tetratricopeptide (TPR) repeat protein
VDRLALPVRAPLTAVASAARRVSLLRGVKTLDPIILARTLAARAWPVIVASAAFAPAGAADPPAVAPAPVPAVESVPAAAAASRVDAHAEFHRQWDAKNYEAAAAQAKVVVDLTEKEVGTAGEELQVGLMNLATSQFMAGDYVGAESSYLRAIELTEASPKPRIERLALAVARFERAIAFSRRSEGLLSEAQLPLLEKFADALTELGRYTDAQQIQKHALRIAERKYGGQDPRIAPTLEKIGRWYARVGAYEQALSVLRHAIDIVEKAEGEKSPNLVGPLTAIADCSRRQLMDPAQMTMASPDADRGSVFHDPMAPMPFSPTTALATGQKALDRAVTIATERPDPSPVQLADVRTQYGDWFQTRSQPERALPQYLEAWKAGVRVPYQGKTLADALFVKPVLLQYARPEGWDRYSNRPGSEIRLVAVLLNLTVTADGRATGIKGTDDRGDLRRAEQAQKAAATARYRPRFENGQPVATPDVQFTQIFQVLLPKPEAAKDPPKEEPREAPKDKKT